METIHRVPQPVIAKVHATATAAGCQLVASCDLVVAAEEATFATPGVKIGLFCSTPMVPISSSSAQAVGDRRPQTLQAARQPNDLHDVDPRQLGSMVLQRLMSAAVSLSELDVAAAQDGTRR